ncbi:voltage-gated potassium channel [Rozella allomycis CSF55]|uniref:Voltage-gated potassium channel n=1 Tax=Rozella allomycis (strain CSF55) TaxID=988480 RepID=A0A4P9YKK1_ROZAC|nr:voltage-gated potassium channel [Rozella allomycis CSF55]
MAAMLIIWLMQPIFFPLIRILLSLISFTFLVVSVNVEYDNIFTLEYSQTIIASVLMLLSIIFEIINCYKSFDLLGGWKGPLGMKKAQYATIISFIAALIFVLLSCIIFSAIEGWTFAISGQFVLVTFTTTGFGNIVPSTDGGIYATMIFGTVGIIIMGVMLGQFGSWLLNSLTRKVKHVVSKFKRPAFLFDNSRGILVKYADIVVVSSIVLIIWFLGALVYVYSEKWRYLDSVYFTWTLITTIGYGNIVPASSFGIAFQQVQLSLGLVAISSVINFILSKTSQNISETARSSNTTQ